jgi:hypothetical protein
MILLKQKPSVSIFACMFTLERCNEFDKLKQKTTDVDVMNFQVVDVKRRLLKIKDTKSSGRDKLNPRIFQEVSSELACDRSCSCMCCK